MWSDYPVVLIIYNRHEILKKILAVLDKVKIKKLYIIADGPKNNKNDIEKVNKTRKLIEQSYKNLKIKIYSKKNLGLKKRIITGLDLVFAKEKAAAEVFLITNDKLKPALNLYKSSGFNFDLDYDDERYLRGNTKMVMKLDNKK